MIQATIFHRVASGHVLSIHPALRQVEKHLNGYKGRFHDLLFLVTIAQEKDGKFWLHASVSRRDNALPSYSELITLKNYTIGSDKTAYQVFPPEAQFFHGHPGSKKQVLHLWCCLDGDVTPDFRREGPGGLQV
jgi:hypothetical protein